MVFMCIKIIWSLLRYRFQGLIFRVFGLIGLYLKLRRCIFYEFSDDIDSEGLRIKL